MVVRVEQGGHVEDAADVQAALGALGEYVQPMFDHGANLQGQVVQMGSRVGR